MASQKINKYMRRNVWVAKAYNEMQKKKPDLEKCFKWLNTAASKNDPEALYAIGTWYLHGRYVKKNPKTAVEYFLKAIDGNFADAYFDLGVSYEKGIGVVKNKAQAFSCYLNAALRGEKQSIYEVGRCYYYGIGVGRNIKIGNIWLKYAKANGIG
jgi:uncharacterized protein